MKKIVAHFFYSNYFIGSCLVALSIASNLQQGLSLNHPLYYLFIFSVSVFYYTQAYTNEPNSTPINERAKWYIDWQKAIRISQWVLAIFSIASAIILITNFITPLLSINLFAFCCCLIFPLMAFLYYGSISPSHSTHILRNIGWLKPFVIGFVWTGVVVLYPMVFHSIETSTRFQISTNTYWQFLSHFLFISVLCILFDIKDHIADHNSQIKTFVVQFGLKKTGYFILLPMILLGYLCGVLFFTNAAFSMVQVLINTIPFGLLLMVTWSMQRKQTILYYLAIIDGLMLVKAVCGIISIYFLK